MANWERTSVVFQRFLQILFIGKSSSNFQHASRLSWGPWVCHARRLMTLPWRVMAILSQNPGTEHGRNSRRICWVRVIKTRLAGRSTGRSSNKRMENFISGHLDRYKSKWFGDHWRQQSCSWVQPLKGQRKNSVLCCRLESTPPSRVAESFNSSTFRDKVTEKEVIIKRLVKMGTNCLKL